MDSDEEETFICIGNPVEQIDEGIPKSKDECLVFNKVSQLSEMSKKECSIRYEQLI